MLRATALVFLSRNLQKVVALLITILIGRLLQERGVGAYGLLVTTLTFASALGTLGLGPAHVYLRGQRRMSISNVLGNALVGALWFGCAAVAVFTLLRPFLRIEAVNPTLLTLLSLVFPLAILQSYLDFLWQGENRLGTFSVLYGLRAISLLTFLLVGLQSADPFAGMAWALILNLVFTVLVSAFLVHRRYGFRPRFELALFWASLRYGLRVQPGSVAQIIGYRVDFFLLNALVGTQTLGLYVVATNFAEALWMVPYALSAALLPRVATGDESAAQAITARTLRVTSLVSVLSGLAVFALAEILIRIAYGSRFLPAVPALRILLVGTVVFSLQKVLANYFIGQGRASWFLRATLLAMLTNLLLNLWLIPQWGVAGAAFASAVSYTLSTMILGALFLRWSHLPLRDLLLPTSSDVHQMAQRLTTLRRKAARLAHGGLAR